MIRKRKIRKGAIARIDNFVLKNGNDLLIYVNEYEVRAIAVEKEYELYRDFQDQIEILDELQEGD